MNKTDITLLLSTRFICMLKNNISDLIKKCKDLAKEYFNTPKAFIEHSNTMDDVYNKSSDSNTLRKRKMMQDNEYISRIYHKILFFCFKRSHIKFCTLCYNKYS